MKSHTVLNATVAVPGYFKSKATSVLFPECLRALPKVLLVGEAFLVKPYSHLQGREGLSLLPMFEEAGRVGIVCWSFAVEGIA